MKKDFKQLSSLMIVFGIIFAAYICRALAMSSTDKSILSLVRAGLYMLLFALWGYSIDRRIIQPQVRHCMRLTALLMLLWLLFRTLKYEIVATDTASRYLWYLYYLPMLFIPLLGVYIALSFGKSEDFRLSAKHGLLAIIPTVLFLLIITNDLHQFVFAFKGGVPVSPSNNSYVHKPLYYICIVWMAICMLFSLINMLKKSNIPGGKKRLMPFIMTCVMGIYMLLYMSGLQAIRHWIGDMNVTFCLLYAAVYESCIRCRMIQSNTGYVELFKASTLAACIADKNGNIVLRSHTAPKDIECPMNSEKIIYQNGIRVSRAPISGGYVVWQDNVRRLTELNAKLNENKAEMKSNKKKLEEAYRVQKKLHELAEKNEIYNELEEKYGRQTAQIWKLLEQSKQADSAEINQNLKKIALLGTYIKRSANLYFLCSEYELLPQQEIRLTVDEAVRALTTCGTECGVIYRTAEPMLATEVMRLFDIIKAVAETAIEDFQSLFISVSDNEMVLSAETTADLSCLELPQTEICHEDGIWLVRTQIRRVAQCED